MKVPQNPLYNNFTTNFAKKMEKIKNLIFKYHYSSYPNSENFSAQLQKFREVSAKILDFVPKLPFIIHNYVQNVPGTDQRNLYEKKNL